MKLNVTDFLFAMSFALDAVEQEISGGKVQSGHGKRVAYMLMKMIQPLHLSVPEQVTYIGCAILHDNGLAEYIRGELELQYTQSSKLRLHVELGEKNMELLPFDIDIKDIILHHHENADGSGPLRLKRDEINEIAHLLHIADIVELACNFDGDIDLEFEKMKNMLEDCKNKMFSEKAVSLFEQNITKDDFLFMGDENFTMKFRSMVPDEEQEYEDEKIKAFAEFFMKLVDYKSSFTKNHSLGIAQKAYDMAQYYGFPHDKVMRFYFAGAMHDIGKLVISNQILEKPEKLDVEEFEQMKHHAEITYYILTKIHGFEDIAEWGGNHHEKLDGMGYPRGLTAEQLTFEDRLMACIDIFQALTESRPYKKHMPAGKAILIMKDMVETGKIDGKITEDIAKVYCTGEEIHSIYKDTETKQWRCKVCGYVHEGENPPEVCPICDSAGAVFEKK